uniref:Protein kinase domain-containing protein n=1 Tax=Globisporangium ultimum (strain ATCC 200006 / CBS 805.95 / DAOM BR144) TaxID=431595 RepID=K3WEK8_GLOUD
MENYNIYDEVGRGTHSFVYKARRKRSIEYVAVKSTTKCRMDKASEPSFAHARARMLLLNAILNEVQLLHKLDSRYVLKFYNWYESQNHIWLIFEYCIGGDLLNLITQDKRLPEPAVKLFGSELVAGLQFLHSNGILFCDLKPANILIDEFGSLKLAPGSPNYMAPELFHQPAIHSFASDFWALGCVLYELCVGRQPFTHTNFSELARMG